VKGLAGWIPFEKVGGMIVYSSWMKILRLQSTWFQWKIYPTGYSESVVTNLFYQNTCTDFPVVTHPNLNIDVVISIPGLVQ
jgi:hypothetical protein